MQKYDSADITTQKVKTVLLLWFQHTFAQASFEKISSDTSCENIVWVFPLRNINWKFSDS